MPHVAGFEKLHRHDKDLAVPEVEARRLPRCAPTRSDADRDATAQREVRLWQLLDRERAQAWKMARQKWDGEWNNLIMNTLRDREQQLGRRMTVAEIMKVVERLMTRRDIPLRFVPYRGQ